jgi:hypothetical protein
VDTGGTRTDMILFRSSAGEGCIELHTDGDTYWFTERLPIEDQIRRTGGMYNPRKIIGVTIQNRWTDWPSRPWLAPMLEFMVDYFGEDLFTLVTLENL